MPLNPGALFGPWAPDLAEAERRARCRSLAALALLIVGPRHPFTLAMLAAEGGQDAAAEALHELDLLPSLLLRRILTSYSALHSGAGGSPLVRA